MLHVVSLEPDLVGSGPSASSLSQLKLSRFLLLPVAEGVLEEASLPPRASGVLGPDPDPTEPLSDKVSSSPSKPRSGSGAGAGLTWGMGVQLNPQLSPSTRSCSTPGQRVPDRSCSPENRDQERRRSIHANQTPAVGSPGAPPCPGVRAGVDRWRRGENFGWNRREIGRAHV